MSERPKVQISKVCVVHSHPGFESQRYRHQGPRCSTRSWVPGNFVCSACAAVTRWMGFRWGLPLILRGFVHAPERSDLVAGCCFHVPSGLAGPPSWRGLNRLCEAGFVIGWLKVIVLRVFNASDTLGRCAHERVRLPRRQDRSRGRSDTVYPRRYAHGRKAACWDECHFSA